jgi:flagellar biosynthetic protein FliQ
MGRRWWMRASARRIAVRVKRMFVVDVDQAVELGRAAIMLTLLIGTPIMAVAVVVGLVISILQAVTQIQDQTISFVPKIVAMFLVLIYVLPWIMDHMIQYSIDLFHDIPLGI